MKKRFISMLLAVVMILGCLSMTAFAASAFTVSAQNVEVSQKATEVSVPIIVTCSEGVASFGVNVSYDADAFTFKSITKGDVPGTLTSNVKQNPSRNPFKVSYSSADDLELQTYTLATVVFTLNDNIQPGDYTIAISKPVGDYPANANNQLIKEYTIGMYDTVNDVFYINPVLIY